MKELCYVCLYVSYLDAFEALTAAEAGELLRGLLRYAKTGKAPKITGRTAILWPLLKDQHDRDRARYELKCETNSRNGKKGGRPRKNPQEDLLLT